MFLVTTGQTFIQQEGSAVAHTAWNGHIATFANMTAGDTAVVKVNVSGGTKTVDIEADRRYNYFSGSLIN